MTRESQARRPQVTKGVNKICSQFVLCRIRRRKKKQKHALVYPPVSHLLFCLLSVLLRLWLIATSVPGSTQEHVCSGSNDYFNWVTRVTSNQQLNTRHSIKKEKPSNPQSSVESQGQRESVSFGTGTTDLGGIGKTISKQVYYIWRAIFTASTKRTQKSVVSHYLRLINNNPTMPNVFNAVTKRSEANGARGRLSSWNVSLQ